MALVVDLPWDTSTSRQISNCDGINLKICFGQKFQWPQEGLNCESPAYKVIMEDLGHQA